MLHVFILEDDHNQQRHLKTMIEKISREISLITVDFHLFNSTAQLKLNLPLSSKENVYILDLEINGIKTAGLELSQLIRQHDELANIIFITVHDEFVYTTYKYRVSALDFIAKDRENIYEELKRDFIHIKNEIQSSNKEIQLNYNLHKIEKLNPHFFRAQRSYLINPSQVRQIDFLNHTIFFYNGSSCPISRRHEKALFKLITKQNKLNN